MGKITIPDISQQTTLGGLQQFLSTCFNNILAAINGGIKIPDNMDAQSISVTFSTTATDTLLNHKLGRVPTSYIVLNATVPMSVYTGQNAASTTQFFLRSNAVGNANILLF